jgi:hypothetical protein
MAQPIRSRIAQSGAPSDARQRHLSLLTLRQFRHSDIGDFRARGDATFAHRSAPATRRLWSSSSLARSSGSSRNRDFERTSDARETTRHELTFLVRELQPDREIEIAVRPGDPTHMEVDRPAAEQPVVERPGLEKRVHLRERGQRLVTSLPTRVIERSPVASHTHRTTPSQI